MGIPLASLTQLLGKNSLSPKISKTKAISVLIGDRYLMGEIMWLTLNTGPKAIRCDICKIEAWLHSVSQFPHHIPSYSASCIYVT